MWIFYEGPPTANGKPGVHHVEPRTFKDVYPRFKTMTGHLVPRKGGWDCHGLPVELEVEKEIGTTGKRDIEAFGIAEFNERCRASVKRYVDEFERLTERIGFWVDLDEAYWTMDAGLHRVGVVVAEVAASTGACSQEADRVTAYCPRCGTALSDAEVAQGYADGRGPERLRPLPDRRARAIRRSIGASLLVWTTTPWTLPSNTGRRRRRRRDVRGDRARRRAADRGRAARGRGPRRRWRARSDRSTARRWSASRYEPPYPNVEGAHRVVAGDFVSMDDGTGIVHLAPAFGARGPRGRPRAGLARAQAGRRRRAVHRPRAGVRARALREGRRPADRRGSARSRACCCARRPTSTTTRSAGAATRRCSTTRAPRGTSAPPQVKDRLLAVNDEVGWFPEHIKHGRYGNWLENNVDWALSRERYWGTPLPIWRCAAGPPARRRLAHRARRARRARRRPTSTRTARRSTRSRSRLPECGERGSAGPRGDRRLVRLRRDAVRAVGLPPELGRGVEEFERPFPADFISEAIDQTRGWFYTLMAEGVLHFDSTAYRNVVCLGHIIAGRRPEDVEVARQHVRPVGGARPPGRRRAALVHDHERLAVGVTPDRPRGARRRAAAVPADALERATRSSSPTRTPTASTPSSPAPPRRRAARARPVGAAPSSRGTVGDGPRRPRCLRRHRRGPPRSSAFVDDLSNWYVRRSRRRFWNPGGDGERRTPRAAFHTLYECLVTVATLLAPFTPFVAEELWRNLAAGRDGRPELGAPRRLPRAPTRPRSTTSSTTRWRRRGRSSALGRTRARRDEDADPPAARRGRRAPARRPRGARAAARRRRRGAERASGSCSRSRPRSFGRWHAKPNFKALGPRSARGSRRSRRRSRADDGSLAATLARAATVDVRTSDGDVVARPRRRRPRAGRPRGLGRGERRRRHARARPRAHRRAAARGRRARADPRRPGRAEGGGPRRARPDPARASRRVRSCAEALDRARRHRRGARPSRSRS